MVDFNKLMSRMDQEKLLNRRINRLDRKLNTVLGATLLISFFFWMIGVVI